MEAAHEAAQFLEYHGFRDFLFISWGEPVEEQDSVFAIPLSIGGVGVPDPFHALSDVLFGALAVLTSKLDADELLEMVLYWENRLPNMRDVFASIAEERIEQTVENWAEMKPKMQSMVRSSLLERAELRLAKRFSPEDVMTSSNLTEPPDKLS